MVVSLSSVAVATVALCNYPLSVSAWTSKTTKTSRSSPITTKNHYHYQPGKQCPALSPISATTKLYNVPPPAESDVEKFQEYASKQSPPSSFFELQQDCIRATRLARSDGHNLLEVEFPPLPANVLEMQDVSAYDVSEANLNLALEYSKGLLQSDDSINKIAILFPDEAELGVAVEKFLSGNPNPQPNIVVSSLRSRDPDDDRLIKPEQLLLSLFGQGSGGSVKPIDGVDAYICLTASAQELPDIEELHLAAPDATIITYNLKLDTLRGDLGNPAFPGKDLQDRFLSRIKPVYFLRTRQYSRSTPRPPFIVNYQGCLFRSYPGEFQTLLDTGNGKYRRICGNAVRPGLGLFKQQLTDALIEQGILQKESDALNFLRTGYKTATWWEEDREQASDAWKT